MDRDDDILAALPDPPPPAPRRREAAIAEALARFDGTAEAPRAAADRSQPSMGGWWATLRRPQVGALVAAALVITISLPLAWQTFDRRAGIANEAAPPTTVVDAEPPRNMAATDAVSVAAPPAPPATIAPAAPPPSGADASPATDKATAAPPPSPPIVVASADGFARAPETTRSDQASGAIIVSAQRARAGAPAPPPPPAALAVADAAASNALGESREVVVTGARMAAPKLASKAAAPKPASKARQRGDWNACTVNDPSQSLSRCTKLVTQGRLKSRDLAQTHLADGLQNAWQGDTDEAIAAFGKAIDAEPGLAIAYLNRGLAYERKGDLDRALADLDRAVRYAPTEARGFYARSQILRKKGQVERAGADEKRAIELDRRYEAVVP
jgi:hypothetical protein